jgi:hypothetical protein
LFVFFQAFSQHFCYSELVFGSELLFGSELVFGSELLFGPGLKKEKQKKEKKRRHFKFCLQSELPYNILDPVPRQKSDLKINWCLLKYFGQ